MSILTRITLFVLLFCGPCWAGSPRLPSPQISLQNGVNVPVNQAIGNLSVNNLSSGLSASLGTFWRGDGVWASLPLYSALASTAAPVTNNTALSSLASSYSTSVLRLGFAAVGDSPSTLYVSTGLPCSLNSGAGDGGAQVPTSDGKCWALGPLSASVDVRIWGAVCNGSSDDHAALVKAQAAAATLGLSLIIPNRVCYSSAMIDFGAVPVSGAVPVVASSPFAGPEILCPASIAAPCGNIGKPSPANAGGHADNVIFAYSGTPVSGDSGLSVEAYASTLNDVLVYNSWDGFTFQNGIAAHASRLNAGKIYHDYVVQNGFPELYIAHGRFGQNGANDVQANAYVLETGSDPNTFNCDDCQFNQGSGQTVHYFMDFSGLTAQVNGIYKVSNSYIESVDTAFIHGDGTGSCNRCDFSNSTFNSPGAVLQSFSAAPSSPIFWQALFTGSDFYIGTFNFPPSQSLSDLSNIWILGNATLTGGTGSYGNISNMTVNGSFTLSGAWSELNIANLKVNGTYTDTATGVVLASNVPAVAWTPGLNFSTSNAGLTLSSSIGTSQRQPDGTVAFQFGLQLSAIGSASGSPTITGLPYTCSVYGYGARYTQPLWAVNMTGLTGALTIGETPGAASLTPYQGSGGGVSSMTAANFTGSAILSGSARCRPQ